MLEKITILQSAIDQFWPIEKNSAQFIRECMNTVFAARLDEREVIIRFTPIARKSQQQIEAELNWLKHLKCHQLSVNTAIPSKQDRLIEAYEDSNHHYSIVCFERFTGNLVNVNDKSLWNKTLFHNWGYTLGKLHHASRHYTTEAPQRIQWHEDINLKPHHLRHHYPDARILDAQLRRIEEVKCYPVTLDNYGLIHNDLHHNNFLIKDEQLQIFDFDNACYQWWVHDIAMAIYYAFFIPSSFSVNNPTKDDILYFIKHFYLGYRKQMTLDKNDFRMIPGLLRLRDCMIYNLMLARGGTILVNEEIQSCHKMMNHFIQRFIDDTALINFELNI